MIIDAVHSDRYLAISDSGLVTRGWQQGWDAFNAGGTPAVVSGVVEASPDLNDLSYTTPIGYLDALWPDTGDYEQNAPDGIMVRAEDLAGRRYASALDAAFWMNTLRVPVSAAYLAACAKVQPRTILELGTGGDSAHSTGMFLYWLENVEGPGRLVSVDRHPLSHAWPRYREAREWTFIQGDSLGVLHAILRGGVFPEIQSSFDMIFIDTIHTKEQTLSELAQCCRMTVALLIDDSGDPGVHAALAEFLPEHPDWLRADLHPKVTLLERHPRG